MAASAPDPKELVRRWVTDAINEGRLDELDQICTPDAAARAREWIAPFREGFPDVEMKVVELIAEGDRVAGRFTCSATHLGRWGGREPSSRRFEDVDDVYFFRLEGGRIAEWWGLEDNVARMRQLGISRS